MLRSEEMLTAYHKGRVALYNDHIWKKVYLLFDTIWQKLFHLDSLIVFRFLSLLFSTVPFTKHRCGSDPRHWVTFWPLQLPCTQHGRQSSGGESGHDAAVAPPSRLHVTHSGASSDGESPSLGHPFCVRCSFIPPGPLTRGSVPALPLFIAVTRHFSLPGSSKIEKRRNHSSGIQSEARPDIMGCILPLSVFFQSIHFALSLSFTHTHTQS